MAGASCCGNGTLTARRNRCRKTRATEDARHRRRAPSNSSRNAAVSHRPCVHPEEEEEVSGTRRHALRIIAAPLAASLAMAVTDARRSDALPQDDSCPSCEDSNSIIGDKPSTGGGSFQKAASGLRFIDIKEGVGASPRVGDTVVCDYTMYTSGYQAKLVERTSEKDMPFQFVLGADEAIPVFEESVLEMKQGGVRRVEVPGSLGRMTTISQPSRCHQ